MASFSPTHLIGLCCPVQDHLKKLCWVILEFTYWILWSFSWMISWFYLLCMVHVNPFLYGWFEIWCNLYLWMSKLPSSLLIFILFKMQAIPPVTRMALTRDTWVTVLCRKIRDCWHWVITAEHLWNDRGSTFFLHYIMFWHELCLLV